MANPSLPPLQTHHVTVDLGQVLRNIERASDAVFREKPTLEISFTRKGDMPDVEACFIDSVSALRHILKPALQNTNLRYTKYWKNDQWYVLLSYQDANEEKQHIMITEKDLWVTENNDAHCDLLWRLGYYLLVGLDPYQPLFAFDAINSKMAGYIRCFAAEKSSCDDDRSSAYEPPIATAPPGMRSLKDLADGSRFPKLKMLYYRKFLELELQFAKEIVKAAQDGGYNNQAVNVMINRYSRIFSRGSYLLSSEDDDALSRASESLSKHVTKFMEELLRSPLWLNRYQWYRDDLKLTNCEETKDNETHAIHVTCKALGIKFDVFSPLKPHSPQQLTKKGTE